jgi:multiple sugar transport system permease protein
LFLPIFVKLNEDGFFLHLFAGKKIIMDGQGKLRRGEMWWGYLFAAAPIVGFLLFGMIPLVGSFVVGFTEWDLSSPPEWVGLQNFSNTLSLHAAPLTQQIHEASGEPQFRCNRERVPASEVANYAGRLDERLNQPYVCTPDYVRPAEVLPRGYEEWFQTNLFGTQYIVGAIDPVFWKALNNTFFLLLSIPISLALALGLAVAMNQKIFGERMFRTLYYIPTILPIAALALIWLWLFNPDYGLINFVLERFGFPGNIAWLQDPVLVKPALIIMLIWRGLGYQVLIYVAGLQGVPSQLYEAAEIDGANAWQRFRFITWPGITPTTFFLVITSLIGAFQIFQEPYLMTEGGPYFESTTMVMVIQQNAFRDLQMGYASAQAWILGLIIFAVTMLNFYVSRRWVNYES